MFLPTTPEELRELGWDQPDIILITGDSYIDTPFNGCAVVGKLLMKSGYRVALIAQPDLTSSKDINRLGKPRLFWGVTAGSIDSMVANYTALMKKRISDDNTPGGINNRRPDRATIVYTNLIRRWNKQTGPIVLGGIEASLRRIAHYDYWSDSIRASILLDSKADFLLYGMADLSIIELADALRDQKDPRSIKGLCYVVNPAESTRIPSTYLELPSFDSVKADPLAFIEMFHAFYKNNDPLTARGLYQQHGMRYVIQNPPSRYPSQAELDEVFQLDFERTQHPYYEQQGAVKALETIKFSISTHRGCYGECNFCAIAVHEGRTIRWRSEESIIKEARSFVKHSDFKGIIPDLGGPTANMYGFECSKKLKSGSCPNKRCLTPDICPTLNVDHQPSISLLKRIRGMPEIKQVYIASGIRYDMVVGDNKTGKEYLRELVTHHTSGQLKIAPEHSEAGVLYLMGKPAINQLIKFKDLFYQLTQQAGKNQYLTYYLIAAHPGCGEREMRNLKRFTGSQLGTNPEQAQIYTPTPSTYSSVMYHTGLDPFTLQPIFVEKVLRKKEYQKQILINKGKSLIPQNKRATRLKEPKFRYHKQVVKSRSHSNK